MSIDNILLYSFHHYLSLATPFHGLIGCSYVSTRYCLIFTETAASLFGWFWIHLKTPIPLFLEWSKGESDHCIDVAIKRVLKRMEWAGSTGMLLVGGRDECRIRLLRFIIDEWWMPCPCGHTGMDCHFIPSCRVVFKRMRWIWDCMIVVMDFFALLRGGRSDVRGWSGEESIDVLMKWVC